jgi:hypothetical protein
MTDNNKERENIAAYRAFAEKELTELYDRLTLQAEAVGVSTQEARAIIISILAN